MEILCGCVESLEKALAGEVVVGGFKRQQQIAPQLGL
jgi:hypothetical protein